MSANKMSQDAKKEEFKKYLEKAGVLEVLTKSLVSLYEEPDKPGDAVSYLKKSVGGTENHKAEIEKLQTENAELKSKVCVEQSEVEKHILIFLFDRLLLWRRSSQTWRGNWRNWRSPRLTSQRWRPAWRRARILQPQLLLRR